MSDKPDYRVRLQKNLKRQTWVLWAISCGVLWGAAWLVLASIPITLSPDIKRIITAVIFTQNAGLGALVHIYGNDYFKISEAQKQKKRKVKLHSVPIENRVIQKSNTG